MIIITTINQAWTRIKQWQEISRQRSALNNISDQGLKDIGVSRIDAEREAARPFWDISDGYDKSLRNRAMGEQDTRGYDDMESCTHC